MNERELEKLIVDIKTYSEEALNTPEKSRAFLMRAGIVDENGELTEPYRPTGNEEDEISYRYPSGHKNTHRHVYQEP
ncbi:MAG: hypothetical protein LBP98_00110 [Tannerella sp.]|jgi:hypothetical protein|nr:hypothetical protein [Tannerella sp.]